jgi:hypothetical protein
MLRILCSVAVAIALLAVGSAHAEECATSGAPACGGTCSAGFVCVIGQRGTPCECAAGTPLGVKKLAVKLSFKGVKGTWADDLADEGLENATVDASLAVHLEVRVDDALYATTQTVQYEATQGKTGKAKSPK